MLQDTYWLIGTGLASWLEDVVESTLGNVPRLGRSCINPGSCKEVVPEIPAKLLVIMSPALEELG